MSPARRRSLTDAVRDPLTAKPTVPAPEKPTKRESTTGGVPVLAKLAIGMLLGFAGGCWWAVSAAGYRKPPPHKLAGTVLKRGVAAGGGHPHHGGAGVSDKGGQ